MESSGTPSRPLLILVPDTFGSHIRDAAGRIWLDEIALAGGGLQRLADGPPQTSTSDGAIAALYGPLVTELESECEVDAFDYDWRWSARLAAQRLATFVHRVLAGAERAIHFLAHGAGGFVVLAMLADDDSLRSTLSARRTRIVLLGTPVAGSWDVVRMLRGDHPLIDQLARLSGDKVDRAAVSRIFAGWPGLLEQLPFDASRAGTALIDANESAADRALDQPGVLQPHAAWADLVPKALTSDACKFREWLEVALARADGRGPAGHAAPMFSIAGTGVPTAAGVADLRFTDATEPRTANASGSAEASDSKGVTFLYSEAGDGRVLAADVRIAGAQQLYAEGSHAELIAHTEFAKAYLDLLLAGTSNAFKATAPSEPDAPTVARREPVSQSSPTSVDVIEAATGALARHAAIIFPLRVTVVHGHLRQARFPVAVGHYRGDSLLSAEDALDQAVGGGLRRRFDLGMYAGPEGTVEIVRRPDRHPPGAMVIGLGAVGDLAPTALQRLVTAAAVRYALDIGDDFELGFKWQSAAFSSLLLGTGGGASVSITDCVLAIVRGAIDANRQLRQTRQWDRVRIDQVEFIELFEDVATQAARTVTLLPALLADDLASNEAVDPASTLEIRPGGEIHRPSDPYRWGWWRRIQVKAQPAVTGQGGANDLDALVLQFSAIGDLARLEVESTVQNQTQVLRLVQNAMTDSQADLKLSNTLYELLVPPGIKTRIKQGGNLLLQLDGEAARYPFEAMAERVGERLEPLVIRYGLLRQLETAKFRDEPLAATGLNMLVVGSPKNVLPALAGTRTEAFRVESLARELGWTPTRVTDQTGRAILTELFARDYRILHFAAHGCFSKNPLKSGIIIDTDDYLTAAHVQSLPVVPELVFLNCCHSGRSEGGNAAVPFPQLAASIAEGFIRAGARAVIAAGWAVDDEAALTFATSFYRAFLAGQPFGDAVQEARKLVYKGHATTNTWGAYQCYGDSQYRLRIPRPANRNESTSSAVSRRELIAELRTLAARAGGARGESLNRLQQRFQELRRQLIDSWKDGEVLAEFAAAAAELGNFRDAIGLYLDALRSAKALVPLRAVEQLANILCRSAPTVGPVTGVTTAEADKFYNEAKDWLDWLDVKLAPTKERRALRGAVYKRWALVATSDQQRQKRLARARAAYSEARKLAGDEDSYQLLNWIALRFLLDGPRSRKELRSLAGREWQRATQKERQASEPDFWQRVAVPDALLHVALCDGTIEVRLEEINRAYARALSTGPSARELASVRDHVEFLAAMVPVCCKHAPLETGRALGVIARGLAN